MTNIGKLIKEARFKKGMKGVELAKELGCTSQFVCNWERGVSLPPLNYIKTMCKALSVKVSDAEAALIKDYKEKLKREIK